MPMLSKCLTGALLLSEAAGVRVRRNAQTTKYISGVPVINHHLAFDSSRWDASMLEMETQEAGVEHWIAMVKEGVSDSAIEAACVAHPQCEFRGHTAGVAFMELTASATELAEVLSAEKDKIEFVEPNLPMYADAEAETPWGLKRIRGRSQADVPSRDVGPADGGEGVNVYVMDTGIRTTHTEFTGRAIPLIQVRSSWFSSSITECEGSTSCALDRQGHGTHCAGTVGGKTYGVAKKATLYAVKVLGDNGSGSTAGITKSMDWVATKHTKPAVASMSLGGGYSAALNRAVDELVASGVTVVTAAGNENTDACTKSPGSAGSNINVGATNKGDARAVFSNYGSCLHIYAPGRDVLSSIHTSDSASAEFSGTSMACPHVSGAAALMLQKEPNLTPMEVKAKMVKAATENVVSDAKAGSPNLLLYVE